MVALPVATRPIDVISPSMLERLACPARVAFGQLSSDGGGQSAAAAIGSAMHEAMVTVINGGSVEAAWEDAIGAVSLPTAVDVPRKVKRAQKRFVKRADEVLALLARYPAIRPCIPESEIMSACGEVRGTPDLVWFGPNGAIVVDYKSGVVQSGNQVSGSYIQQIQLYSALVAEKHDVEIDAGWLFSMKQGAVEVDVSPETRAAVFAQAKQGVQNSMIGLDNPRLQLRLRKTVSSALQGSVCWLLDRNRSRCSQRCWPTFGAWICIAPS